MISGFKRKIVVVDDEPLIRTLIADKLIGLGFEAWTAKDAFEAKKKVRDHDPDGLIVDLDLGSGPTGIELITSLGALNPNLAFVLLTNFAPAQWELRSAKHLRYVKKSEVLDFSMLVAALDEVLSGKAKPAAKAEITTTGDVSNLTKKQLNVLSLIAEGKTNQEISELVGVSLGAVEQSVKRIYATLGLESRAQSNRRVAAAQLYSQTMGSRRVV